MFRRLLVWGDVGFYLAVLVVAVAVAPHTTSWFAGIVLAAIAFPLWIVARLQLGSAFSFRPEARRLVTSGLYSLMRHPVYVFGTLAALSALLTLQIWPLLALGVARLRRLLGVTAEERLAAVAAAVAGLGLRALVLGGHSVRFYSIDRSTVDVDFCVALDGRE